MWLNFAFFQSHSAWRNTSKTCFQRGIFQYLSHGWYFFPLKVRIRSEAGLYSSFVAQPYWQLHIFTPGHCLGIFLLTYQEFASQRTSSSALLPFDAVGLIFLNATYTNVWTDWSIFAVAVVSRLDPVSADCSNQLPFPVTDIPNCLSARAAPLLRDFGPVLWMQHAPESWKKILFCLAAVLRSSLETLVVNLYRQTG